MITVKKRVYLTRKEWEIDDHYSVIELGEVQVNLMKKDFLSTDQLEATIHIRKINAKKERRQTCQTRST